MSPLLQVDLPGGLPYKNDRGAPRKFWKEPLTGTRISINGRGPN